MSSINISVYSLPDLELRDRVELQNDYLARADSNGVVYVPFWNAVSVLEISDTGSVTIQGNLTAGGRLQRRLSVAVGPQEGQLCVAQHYPAAVYIIDINTDTIIHTLVLPSEVTHLRSVATTASGQVMVKESEWHDLLLYRSVDQPAVRLSHTPIHWGANVIMLGHNNQLVIGVDGSADLYIVDEEGIWHTVGALKGEGRVRISDLAVWGECLWVARYDGSLELLCPV